MFDRVELRAEATPASCRAMVDSLRHGADPNVPLLLLVADQRDLDLGDIATALEDVDAPVAGAVFPALIHGSQLMFRGAIGARAAAPGRLAAVRNSFEPSAILTPALSELCSDLRGSGAHSVLILADGQAGSAGALLHALRHPFVAVGADFIGGGAGYWSGTGRPCLFTAGSVLPRGGALVVRIDHATSVSIEHGWTRVGEPCLANRTRDTAILELDWRPAIEVYEDVVGRLEANALHIGASRSRAVDDFNGSVRKQFTTLAKQYPIAILKLKDRMVIRDPLSVTDEGGLFTLGPISEHSLMSVVRGDPDALLAAASSAARVARSGARRPKNHPFVADCVSRLEVLGDRFGEELRRIQAEFERPVTGALTLGEIGSVGGRFLEFHNKTVVVAAG